MRSITLDELLSSEIDAVRDYLDKNALASGVEDLYWIPLDISLWNERQRQAQVETMADGFRLAVELGPQWVRFELLVRSESLLNIGGGQADEQQTLFMLRWANDMVRALNLISCGDDSMKGDKG